MLWVLITSYVVIIMLELYAKKGCPFCAKVLNFASTNAISILVKDISNEDYVAELVEKGGKHQVPFLHDTDTGTMMYESDDIVEYLRGFNIATS